MQLSLRHRLVMLMASAMVPLFGLSMVNALLNRSAAVGQVSDDLKFAVSLVAASQNKAVEASHHILTAIGKAPGMLTPHHPDCPRYLATLKEQLGVYVNLGIVGADGYLLCHAMEAPRNVYLGDRDYVQEAFGQRRFTVSGPTLGRLSATPVIVFAMPMFDPQGKAMALAFASMSLEDLARPLLQAALPQGGQMVILDRQGQVLAVSPANPDLIGQPVASPVLAQAVKAMRPGTREGLDEQGRERIYAFLPAGRSEHPGFFVAVSVDRDSVLAPAHRQWQRELALLTLVALFGGWLAWRMGRRVILEPTLTLLEATRQVSEGRLDVRIGLGSVQEANEFSRIAAGFNRMAESLQAQRQALGAELARSQAAQERLRDAQRVGSIGYWQIDLGSRQLWCSDEVYVLLGTDRVTFDGTDAGFVRLVHPDDREAFLAQREVALAGALPLDIEFRILTPAGDVRWLHQFGRSDAGAPSARHRSGVIQDITQRKLAAQALRESEQRYAVLFESAPVPMWVYDMASARFLKVNRVALDIYGYSHQEFLAMTLFDIRPETEHGRLRRQMAQNPPVFRRVWRHRRKDGSVFPVSVFSHAIQYDGRAARFVVAVDISAQIKAESEVQDYLFTLQRAADAAQAITWHRTLEGTLQEIVHQARGVIGAHQALVSLRLGHSRGRFEHAVSLSEKYASSPQAGALPVDSRVEVLIGAAGRALHLTQAELQAHPCWPTLAPGVDQPLGMRGWLAVPLTGRDGENLGLLQLCDRYQGEFTQQDEYVAIELAHLASIAIENTRLLEEVSRLNTGLEHKVAERTAELTRQEALFRALAEQAPQMVWTASPKGEATYYNRAWFELVGGEFKDWSGYRWLAAVHPEDVPGLKANWLAANAGQAPYSGTRRLLAKDGCYHTMTYRASPVHDEHGQVAFWVGIDADITELKEIEAALRLSNQELEAFSYSVSHDLRSPLNTIDGFSRLLAKQLVGSGNEKTAHYLARIQAGVAQMGQLIEDLLSLSQLTRAQLCCEALDLSDMAQGILDECQARAPGRQVVVSVQAGLRADADARLLRVALTNLLTNAWKFTGRLERAEISVGQSLDAAGLPVFFVRDNGAGFDMAYADKLYAPFQRLHSASEFPGTGIGLAIVSRVIERHGGRLWAESTPGCGATFFFTLPRLRLPA